MHVPLHAQQIEVPLHLVNTQAPLPSQVRTVFPSAQSWVLDGQPHWLGIVPPHVNPGSIGVQSIEQDVVTPQAFGGELVLHAVPHVGAPQHADVLGLQPLPLHSNVDSDSPSALHVAP